MERHEALAGRFEANRSHLTAVAYRLLGSPSEAEDAFQEAWLRLGVSQPRPTHPASRRVHQHPNLPHRLKTPTDAESPPSPAAPEPPPTQDHTPNHQHTAQPQRPIRTPQAPPAASHPHPTPPHTDQTSPAPAEPPTPSLNPGGCSGCGGRRCRGRTWPSRPPAVRRRSRRTPRGLGRGLRRHRGS